MDNNMIVERIRENVKYIRPELYEKLSRESVLIELRVDGPLYRGVLKADGLTIKFIAYPSYTREYGYHPVVSIVKIVGDNDIVYMQRETFKTLYYLDCPQCHVKFMTTAKDFIKFAWISLTHHVMEQHRDWVVEYYRMDRRLFRNIRNIIRKHLAERIYIGERLTEDPEPIYVEDIEGVAEKIAKAQDITEIDHLRRP